MRARLLALLLVAGCGTSDGSPEASVDAASDAAADAFDLARCSAGPVSASCASATVDLCSDRRHCGGCGLSCAEGPVDCEGGVCVDHGVQAWPILDSPACSALGDGVVTDPASGLSWAPPSTDVFPDAPAADAHCRALAPRAGVSGFRLPTRVELFAALSRGPRPFANPCALAFAGGPFCTSSRTAAGASIVLAGSEDAMAGRFYAGAAACRARCVHATRRPASPRFVEVKDGVHDVVTDLTWQQETAKDPGATVEPRLFTLARAMEYCATRPSSGATWTLPTVKQYASLFAERRTPAIDPTFADTEPGLYWTFDPQGTGGDKWQVDFGDGTTTAAPVEGPRASVRCVHRGRL